MKAFKKVVAILFAGAMVLGSTTVAMAASPLQTEKGEDGKVVYVAPTDTAVTQEAADAIELNYIAAAKEAKAPVAITVSEKVPTVSKKVLEAAKEAGIPVTIASADGKATFKFGKIENTDKDFVPTVTIGAKVEAMTNVLKVVPEDNKVLQISFEFDGVLPGEAEVSLNLGENSTYKDGEVFFYYFNEKTKKYEKAGKGTIKDKVLTVKMEHCSDYVIAEKELPASIVAAAPGTGDSTPIALMGAVLVLGMGAVAFGLRRKAA